MFHKFTDRQHKNKVITVETDAHHFLKDAVSICIYQYPEGDMPINHITVVINKSDIRKALTDNERVQIKDLDSLVRSLNST